MEFFDAKEEVIDISLTPYGKYKLSLGNFKPKHYAFFDSDIIYNTQYNSQLGYAENQKDIEQRIKSSVRLKTQALRYGAESKITQYIESGVEKEQNGILPTYIGFAKDQLRQPNDPEKNLSTMMAPLGNSDPASFYLPSWQLYSLIGDIDYSEPVYTGSLDPHDPLVGETTEQIPQININLQYETSIAQSSDAQNTEGETNDGDASIGNKYTDTNFYSPAVYEDGSRVFIKKGFSLIDLIEEHVEDKIHNFDMEVYEIIRIGTKQADGSVLFGDDFLKKLKFRKKDYLELGQYQVFDERLIQNYMIDSSYVEYYFEIKVDDEIEEVIRSTATELVDPSGELPTNDIEEPCE